MPPSAQFERVTSINLIFGYCLLIFFFFSFMFCLNRYHYFVLFCFLLLCFFLFGFFLFCFYFSWKWGSVENIKIRESLQVIVVFWNLSRIWKIFLCKVSLSRASRYKKKVTVKRGAFRNTTVFLSILVPRETMELICVNWVILIMRCTLRRSSQEMASPITRLRLA